MRNTFRSFMIAGVATLTMYTTAIPASAAATLTISPSTNLANYQTIKASAAGLAPNTAYTLWQCTTGTTTLAGCATDGPGVAAVTDSTGAFHGIDVDVFVDSYDATGAVNCRTASGACAVSVFLGTTRKAAAPLTFTPLGPPKRGAVGANPTNFVPGGGIIHVSATNWAAVAPIIAGICKAGAFSIANCEVLASQEADTFGTIGLDFDAPTYAYSPNGTFACSTPVTGCVVFVADSRNVAGTYTTVQLTVVQRVAGQIALTPSTALHNNDIVDITGTGWRPFANIAITQCVLGTTICVPYQWPTFLTAESDGTFAAAIAVEDWIDPSHACSSGGTQCTIRALDSPDALPGVSGSANTEQPISFSSPPPLLTGTVYVINPLATDFGGFYVDLAGWAPNGWVHLAACQAGQPISSANCDYNPNTTPQRVDVDGAIHNVQVASLGWPLASPCLVAGACEIVAWDGRDPLTTAVRVPVATTNGDGIIQATPTTNLTHLMSVIVDGYGWTSIFPTDLYQCPSAATQVTSACRLVRQHPQNFEPDHFTEDVYVRASLPDGAGWYTDCSATPNACSIVIAHSLDPAREILRSIPLTFTDTSMTVTSHYSAGEASVIHNTAATLSLSDSEYQRTASWALMYLLGITGTTTTGPVDESGPSTVATTYVGVEYTTLHAAAVRSSLTDAEFQKLSAMAVAYILGL